MKESFMNFNKIEIKKGKFKHYFNTHRIRKWKPIKNSYIVYDFKEDFTFEKGNFYFISGENGVGKSTFMNILMLQDLNGSYETISYSLDKLFHLRDYSSFWKRFINKRSNINFSLRKVRESISKIYQKTFYQPQLTIEENFLFFQNQFYDKSGTIYSEKIRDAETSKEIERLVSYDDIHDSFFKTHSGGQKFMLYFHLFFNKKKNFFVIDEMYNQLSKENKEIVRDKILELNNDDREDIVIINEHQIKKDYFKDENLKGFPLSIRIKRNSDSTELNKVICVYTINDHSLLERLLNKPIEVKKNK